MDHNLIEVLMMDIKDVLELTDFRKINFTPQNNFSIKLSNNEVKTYFFVQGRIQEFNLIRLQGVIIDFSDYYRNFAIFSSVLINSNHP